ncbi:MAG: DotU family type IV/VI secretion system protein [Rhodobacteraceae bacterium]|nr:DotU family type IV/VI secretion system protein [Paracoccaceae bacterium]
MPHDNDGDRTVFGRPAAGNAEAPTRRPQPQSGGETRFGAGPPQDGQNRKTSLAMRQRGGSVKVGQASNPILAAATDLLVLLGRLRSGQIEMQTRPLRAYLMREIDDFVVTAQDHAVSPEDIELARYALTATADDIAQTIPGTDPAYWQQHSMAAELLQDRMAGIGFFVRLENLLAQAGDHKQVLELMLSCLALGFEGKYRHQRNGARALTRLRQAAYQQFRLLAPAPGLDLSIHWSPVLMGGARRAERLPLWICCGVAGCMVMAFFATLSGLLSSELYASQQILLALHDPSEEIALETGAGTGGESGAGAAERASFVAPIPAQLARIRRVLKAEIDSGLIKVEIKGDFIALRLGSQLRFKSGSAELNSDVTPLAQRLGRVLEAENMGGAIIIEGHSDNIQMNGRGRYRTNEALSLARASTVMGVLAGFVSTTTRLRAVGVGANDPLDRANTPKARQLNRRVEILLVREEPL